MSRERHFEALDRQCTPLPEDCLLDTLDDLIERDGVPYPLEDDEWEARHDDIYAWAAARGVKVRI